MKPHPETMEKSLTNLQINMCALAGKIEKMIQKFLWRIQSDSCNVDRRHEWLEVAGKGGEGRLSWQLNLALKSNVFFIINLVLSACCCVYATNFWMNGTFSIKLFNYEFIIMWCIPFAKLLLNIIWMHNEECYQQSVADPTILSREG